MLSKSLIQFSVDGWSCAPSLLFTNGTFHAKMGTIKDRNGTDLTVLPVVWVPGWERRLLKTMQLAIGEFITDSSQGLPTSQRVWGRKGPEPQFSRVFIRSKKAAGSWHKRIGYTAGSWRKRIGYTVARQFLLAQHGAFNFPLIGSLFLARHMLIG